MPSRFGLISDKPGLSRAGRHFSNSSEFENPSSEGWGKHHVTMSLLAALQGNLRTIALEAKKNEVLKDAAERALQKLLKETSSSEEDLSKALASNDDILKPFMLACRDTKDPKLVASSVASIQILISHNAVNPKSLSVVVRILADQVSADEPVQYKILQAVVALLTSSTAIHDKDLAKVPLPLTPNRPSLSASSCRAARIRTSGAPPPPQCVRLL